MQLFVSEFAKCVAIWRMSSEGFFPPFLNILIPIVSLAHITQLSEEDGKGWFVPFCTVMDTKNEETKQDRQEKIKNNNIIAHFRREVY